MNSFVRFLVLTTLCAALCLPSPSQAQEQFSRPPTSTSNGATFINPKAGQIVRPGETFLIDLAVDPGITPVKAVGIISPIGWSNELREGPPYSFTFTVPSESRSGCGGHIIGFQDLTLFGTIVGRRDYDLATTTVDVEEPGIPVSFYALGNMMSRWDPIPNHVRFVWPGSDEQISICGKFPNGHDLDVTQSTYLTLSSENPAVAFVEDDGTVTAVSPGETRVIATYSLGTQKKLFYVPVTVDAFPYGIKASPAAFNFGEIPSDTTSSPAKISVTNQTRNEAHIFKLILRGVTVTSENCSNSTLPPGGSCTITVTFTPRSPGPVHGIIFVPSNDNQVTVVVIGKGT
jgi:ASPM-SPD-2-Hydin domain-containing protein/Big-like domain-containing protein